MDEDQSALLLKALVCHLYKTGGVCVITAEEVAQEKVLDAVEEDGKLTITVQVKRRIITH